MINKNLADYIKEKLAMGYDINTIRSALFKWGYNLNDVDQTIHSLYYPEYYPREQEKPKTKKEHNLLNFFFKPNNFFDNQKNYSLKKAMKYFLFSFLILFLTQPTIIFFKNLFENKNIDYILTSILTRILGALFFLLSIALFFIVLLGIYFILFKYWLKLDISFSLLLTILLFSLVPYILINSINNLALYNIITLFNVSIGFFNINIFLLLSLTLFSLGLSKNQSIEFKKSLFYTFVPFILLTAFIILIFHDVVKINLLGIIFEKF